MSCLFSLRCVSFFTALQVNGGWRVTYSSSNVCSLRGEMVYLSCTYEYPNNVQYRPATFNTLWFTKVSNKQPVDLEHDADYTGRVESSCGLVKCPGSRCHGTCKLRIRDLRQTDSAFYKFRFNTNQPGGENTGDPGVKLSVQGKLGLPVSAVCVGLLILFVRVCLCMWVCVCVSVALWVLACYLNYFQRIIVGNLLQQDLDDQ